MTARASPSQADELGGHRPPLEPRRILIIRGGAIGDFVLTLPTIGVLRAQFPRAHVEILGYRHIAALAEKRFYADAVRSIESGPLSSFFGRATELASELREYFASFDLIVSYLFDPDGIFETNVRRCSKARFVRGPAKAIGGEHAARQLAAPLGALGLTLHDPAAKLFPTHDDLALADRLVRAGNKPVVAIHPGSGSAAKNWPVERWCELMRAMAAASPLARFAVVGGEADTQGLEQLRGQCAAIPFTPLVHQPLTLVAAALSRCAHFVGHDSGISHIAAAVGTRATLLFGPTEPDVWAPANEEVRVIRAPSGRVADLSVEEVFRAVMS